MNTMGVRDMLCDKDENGDYKIPFLVVCDAFQSETVAFADLVLPDTTYLERHDVMSILDRPISDFEGPIDSVRIPVLPPKGECKPACVLACPADARIFGDVHDPNSEISTLIREQGGYALMPEWGTKPANHYLPRRKQEMHIHADELERAERAWRSATKWRTSWLAREVIVLPAAMGLITMYGAAHYMAFTKPLFTVSGVLPVDLSLLIGLAATGATFALFVCTGMIYASIRFIREWATPLTIFNFIFMGGASGFVLAALFSLFEAPELVALFGFWAIILTLAALITRSISLWRNANGTPKSTIQSAIGVRHPKIVQTATGAMDGSFNTKEFRSSSTLSRVRQAKWAFMLLVFIVPLALLALALTTTTSPISWPLLALAFIVQLLGLLIERWTFFADATHPQNLYYQSM